ncbi:MAG: hypothetical protein E7Z92_01305 [Cyanobacteria bacterium SIG31]|nr:hypothetical protein [Cyanobacteria bacterium SIG31]
MTTSLKGLEFDPGFAPYILAFQGTIEYLYMDLNRFKNFSQKKLKFMQYNKKMIEIFDNNIGFYIGCLLWAAYIKTQPKQEILSNHCFGKTYNEEENTSETDFMIQFTELFPKDMKYFIGKNFSFEEEKIRLLKVYKEFLIINKGFVESKYNTDIILPESVKTENATEYKDIIDKTLKTEDLSKLIEQLSTVI